jgi:alpha-L-fucosidase
MTALRAFLFVSVIFSTYLTNGLLSHAEEYEPEWKSLARHKQAPEWFRDAKFGIYFHWGPYAVPAFGNEHYPRTMYGHVSGKPPKPKKAATKGIGFQTYREHEFHIRTYGQPKDFEYHNLFPLFTAQSFNAEEWADLFFLAGAKFAGPVAMHHDGFAMWDSAVTPWNSLAIGPRRDVVGEMARAIRKRQMKFITTFHHAKVGRAAEADPDKHRWHYLGRQKYLEREVPEKAISDDKRLEKLYGTMPWPEFLTMWKALLSEVIQHYEPDLIWFDSWLDRIPEISRNEFLAEYFNAAKDWNKDVVVTYKQEDLPADVGVVDYEKGRLDDLTNYAWLTDDTISAGPWTTTGSWSYTEELDIKSAKVLLHTLIDIVSKNGNLLLNISPTADGTIPNEQRESLLGMGTWLRANGEAIYGTRPFRTYGEGPKRLTSSGHFVEMSGEYTSENIRFTQKGTTVFAIQLGWPGSRKQVQIKSLGRGTLKDRVITRVSVVDSPESIEWECQDEALFITAPSVAPNNFAICYRIETTAL